MENNKNKTKKPSGLPKLNGSVGKGLATESDILNLIPELTW